ncbi:hypothetical protein SAMN05421770_10248 [Granulicella rosea]|uniref:Uncharacterized protein n=1 Tax=Granulicella rosea TaxID=474952 RepID=A0A239GR35_9BACT|nr:hypothetical protein [Granulicella rosea]SNS71686.1 hypothetical protein SAMN05421770_10248 [Granulicella rosea]
MQLARFGSKSYAYLPSGILIVDPDPGLLAARTQLLSAAMDYVAASSEESTGTDLCNMEVEVAILSQTLGQETLLVLAQEIRQYWPDACILLFGNVDVVLEDRLYDDAIDVHCRPEQLLGMLHKLRKNAKETTAHSRREIGALLCDLSEEGQRSLHAVPSESDPSKQPASAFEEQPTGWDVPRDEYPQSQI